MKLTIRLFLGGAAAMSSTRLLCSDEETFPKTVPASFLLVANSTLILRRLLCIDPLAASLTPKA